jgi:hypothetical protein
VTQIVCHAGLHSAVSSVLVGATRSLLSNIKNTKKGESNKMNELLTETVQDTVCKFDLHSECASGEAYVAVCAKCTADAFSDIVRMQL